MATNLAKLKGKGVPPSINEKGTPPLIEDTPNNLEIPPREKPAIKEKMRPLQFLVPESVFNEFSREAYERIGMGHGAKKGLFMELWEADKKKRLIS